MITPADPDYKRLALADFFSGIDAEPWSWGEWDCTMMIAHWIEHLHGVNPLPGIEYHTASEAVTLSQGHGGFTAWVIRTLDGLGFRRAINSFESGDVAVLDAPHIQIPSIAGVMAIRQGKMWIVKTPRGLIGREFNIVAAWRL